MPSATSPACTSATKPAIFLNGSNGIGKSGCKRLMSRGFGAEDSDYTMAVGQNFIIGMVARVLRPGCKVDTMPVLEGAQGIRKSSGLGILGGKWFAELHQDIANKDFYLALPGKMLLEISEMHAFNRSESERLKGVVSCQIDRYRAPFDRRAVDHPRRCVFAGTTNRDDWNRDDTGARRFWPIVCGRIDLDWLAANRDQLLAEAVAKFNAGASWWDVPADDARREQDARRPEDPWQPTIANWLIGRSEVTITDILASCLVPRCSASGQECADARCRDPETPRLEREAEIRRNPQTVLDSRR